MPLSIGVRSALIDTRSTVTTRFSLVAGRLAKTGVWVSELCNPSEAWASSTRSASKDSTAS
jgi:hypothetical protein